MPEVAIAPLHAPPVVQEVAFVDDHERLALEPTVMELGLTAKLTVAAAATGKLGVGVIEVEVPLNDMVTGMDTAPLVDVTVPVTVIGGKLCPAPSEALVVQVSAVALRVQVQPLPVMEAMVNPVGGSVTVTVPLLAPVPALETVIV